MDLTSILTSNGTVSIGLALTVLALLWLYMFALNLRDRVISVELMEKYNTQEIHKLAEKVGKIDVNVEWIKNDLSNSSRLRN